VSLNQSTVLSKVKALGAAVKAGYTTWRKELTTERTTVPVSTAGPFLRGWDREGNLRMYGEMRRKGEIKFPLSMVFGPLRTVEYYLDSDNVDAKEFVKTNLDEIWTNLFDVALKCIPWGFIGGEIVWEYADGKYHVRRVKDLDPRFTTIHSDELGHFAGLSYRAAAVDPELPPEKCFLCTLNKEFSNLYGVSQLDGAIAAWRRKQNHELATDRYFDKTADPPIKGRAPGAVLKDAQGNDVNCIKAAADSLQALRSGGTAVFPSDNGPDGKPVWDAEYMNAPERGTMFDEHDRLLHTELMRAIGLPDLVGTQHGTGAYALGDIHFRIFFNMLDSIIAQIIEAIQERIVDVLVEVNFGPNVKVRLKIRGLSDDTKELLREILKALIAQVAPPKELLARLDYKSMLDVGGIPTIDEDEALANLDAQSTAAQEAAASAAAAAAATAKPVADAALSPAPSSQLAAVKVASPALPALDAAHVQGDARAAAISDLADAAKTKALASWRDAADVLALRAAQGEPLESIDLSGVATALRAAMLQADVMSRAQALQDVEAAVRAHGVQMLAATPGDSAGDLDYDAAVKYLKAKGVLSDSDLADMGQRYSQHAFTIAGVESTTLLEKVKGYLADAIAAGATKGDTVKAVRKAFEDAGVEPLSDAHAATVFDTNVRQAYHAGWENLMRNPAVTQYVPAWRYLTAENDRVCNACAPLDGLVFAVDDPIWERITPQLHFGCHCTRQGVDKWDLADGTYELSDSSLVKSVASAGFGGKPDLGAISAAAKGVA
jgi:SPP1 gp7 family putative phage head morphogenesis protein